MGSTFRASDDLSPLLADLRARLDRDNYRGKRDLRLGNELALTDVELAVCVLLAEVDYLAALPRHERERPHVRARRAKLADTLRRLRERLLG